MPRDSAKPHVLLVYVDRTHRTRIEVREVGEDALEATCTFHGTMCASSVRQLTRSILRAALRIQGITWSHDAADRAENRKRTITYSFRRDWVASETPAPAKPKKRSV